MTETTEAHASAPSIIEPVPIMKEWITCSWYVATVRRMRTPPRQKREDVKALEAMQTLGIPAWYATGRRRESRCGAKGRKRMIGYLMFPGYLFIAHDGDRAKFARSLGVRHISGMLGCDQGCGFVPLRVPSYAMQALFAGEELRQHHLEIESEP
ncbi:MAG: hypothetical protein GY945_10420, partial [Rhodobacteraceae bacterium]|nr:hypothetical protein [Paracoccaceae bacterium]